jgi:hypothetical protein
MDGEALYTRVGHAQRREVRIPRLVYLV